MKYLSLFSGIGGFELGIQRAFDNRSARSFEKENQMEQNLTNPSGTATRESATCIGFSEIDKYATQVYQKQFERHRNYGDITQLDPETLPEFGLLCGGFPCQAFSIAGKRRGFDDTRGTLFFDIARILKEKHPRLLLLENVKGLLSHDNGNTFKTIISTLDELRYDLQWQVLNSKDFGVPQNRERVFIIGHLRGTPRPKVFPIGESGQKDDRKRPLAHTLNATDWRGANRNQKQTTIAVPVLTPDRAERRQRGRRFKANGDPSFTLTSQDKHGIYDGKLIRRLTPIECERLQGFPDNWTKDLSDTQRYKTLGNAVTVNVIEEIVRLVIA